MRTHGFRGLVHRRPAPLLGLEGRQNIIVEEKGSRDAAHWRSSSRDRLHPPDTVSTCSHAPNKPLAPAMRHLPPLTAQLILSGLISLLIRSVNHFPSKPACIVSQVSSWGIPHQTVTGHYIATLDVPLQKDWEL